MSTVNEILTFEHENEHVFEYNLQLKKKFSAPKIYIANGDLTKRWYVCFSYRNPETSKLERIKNIYGKTNTFKTKEERLSVLNTYRRRLALLLKDGYNPFEDNSEVYRAKTKIPKTNQEPSITLKGSTKNSTESKEEKPNAKDITPKMTCKEAFDFSIKLKQNVVKSRTLSDYKNKVKTFLEWLDKTYPKVKTIDQLTRKISLNFLNDLQLRTSPRTRNNYRLDLGSLMQVLENNEIIDVNYMRKISIIKTSPERHKRYTLKTQKAIFEYLEKEDPILLLYIKFISYGFLRPIEVCRLKVKNINLENNTLQFKAKNSPLKTKIIPKILRDDLPDLASLDPDHFLIIPKGFGAAWEATENNRRDYFTKRFKSVVKDHFNLGKDYGLYSFRHTYITKLYRELEKLHDPNTAKNKLMQITGHSTITALEKYLRDIDAALPEDYSNLLK